MSIEHETMRGIEGRTQYENPEDCEPMTQLGRCFKCENFYQSVFTEDLLCMANTDPDELSSVDELEIGSGCSLFREKSENN